MRRKQPTPGERSGRRSSVTNMTGRKRNSGRRASLLVVALLAALSLTAIEASGAQALDWTLGSSHPAEIPLSSPESVEGSGSFSISAEILGEPTYVDCSTASIQGSIAAAGTGSSTITGSGCHVVIPTDCELGAPLTLEAKVELVEVGGKLYRKFVPTSEGMFGTMDFVGPECDFAGVIAPLHGSFAARETSSQLLANQSISLAQAESWPEVELKLGKARAVITGAVTEHLRGSQAGHTWRGIWQGSNGAWVVEGEEVEWETPLTTSQLVRVSGGPLGFSTSFIGAPISVDCSEVGVEEANLIPGGTEGMGGLTLSGCSVQEPPGCSINSPGFPSGSFKFNPLIGTLSQVEGKVYETFTPASGENFVELEYTGAECPLAGITAPIKGSFSVLGYSHFEESQKLAFSEATDAAVGSELKWGKALFQIHGSLEQALLGGNYGTPWGVH